MKKLLGIMTMGTVVALAGCHKADDQAKQSAAQQTAAPSTSEVKAATDNQVKTDPAAQMNEQEKGSYALGVIIADSLKSEMPSIQLSALTSGLHDAYDGHPKMNVQESKATFQGFQKKTYQDMAKRNLMDGQAFAEQYAKQEGVKKTDSGILYRVITSGDAHSPQPTDASNVQVTYEGRHINGNVFDASKTPVDFNTSQVIAGWREAVKMMHVGDEWEVVVPSNKAYGEQGVGEDTIAPNETLIFKIKLLKVEGKTQH